MEASSTPHALPPLNQQAQQDLTCSIQSSSKPILRSSSRRSRQRRRRSTSLQPEGGAEVEGEQVRGSVKVHEQAQLACARQACREQNRANPPPHSQVAAAAAAAAAAAGCTHSVPAALGSSR